ncbi:hypothetical protein KY290_034811 [Solanum tuberosum]|uniref:BAG domain-containing protein n=1 Tax=Solanum tuberosum TaxID=4113 RepID=A0ABQ7U628_SOLTU|nr:hypothetical protein KY290_034811 [Solanum tuberosum]
MENASKDITSIRLEIDKLAKQVANVEWTFMLDGITADGDLKLQRRMQVKRVQKYIETLDMLKIRNSALGNDNAKVSMNHKNRIFTGQMPKSIYINKNKGRWEIC